MNRQISATPIIINPTMNELIGLSPFDCLIWNGMSKVACGEIA